MNRPVVLLKEYLKKQRPVMRVVHSLRVAGNHVRRVNGSSLRTVVDVHGRNKDSYVYLHWSDSVNFGDRLSSLLTAALSGREVISTDVVPNISRRPVYSCIGSVLQFPQRGPLEVWGSGFIYGKGSFLYAPRKIHAVRGKLTREIALKQGIYCPDIYGDPAVLAFDSHVARRSREYRVGVIPHYADAGHDTIRKLRDADGVTVIDVMQDWKKIVAIVAGCDYILSSSLHGLILADAMMIPNRWLGVSDLVMKDRFKFLDYFSSISRNEEPLLIDDFSLNKVVKQAHLNHVPFSRERLLNACPFLCDGFERRLSEMRRY